MKGIVGNEQGKNFKKNNSFKYDFYDFIKSFSNLG